MRNVRTWLSLPAPRWRLHIFLMFTIHPGSAQGRSLHLSIFMLQWKSSQDFFVCKRHFFIFFSFFFHFFFFWFRKGNKQGRLKDISKGTQLLTNVLFSTCYRGERSLDSISIHFYFDYRLKVGTHYSSDAFPTHNAIWRHDQWHFYFLPQSVSVI